MKSSKMDVYDYNQPIQDPKTLSPFTYYQPFQSSFDPEFSISAPKPTLWPNNPQNNRWSLGSDGPPGTSQMSTGISNFWDIHRNSRMTAQPSAPPMSEVHDFYSVRSTSSNWNDLEGRSLGNSVWRNPVSPKPSYSGYDGSQSSKCLTSNVGSLGMYSQYPQHGDGMGSGRVEDSSFRMKGGFPVSARQGNFSGSLSHSSYYHPLMLGSSGKAVTPPLYKTGHNRPMMCNFCRNNKEVPDIYLNHYLYDPETKILSCPVLRKHVCEICGGTGDKAHTLQYCPVNRERGLQSKVPVLLKTRTITNSTGKIRRD